MGTFGIGILGGFACLRAMVGLFYLVLMCHGLPISRFNQMEETPRTDEHCIKSLTYLANHAYLITISVNLPFT